ncbi:MAG: hypothetical protein OER04_15780 [Cyclobacteriaceae bacterium]|nr:hypothetical protein [Cyclobacteriaceae bacterium]
MIKGDRYSGTYTNGSGKQKITCGPGGYYVAAKGTWLIRGLNDESELDISVLDDSDPIKFEWTEIPDIQVYRFVVIDKECLEERLNLEECMMRAGESDWPDIEYGDGDIPAKPLIRGKEYLFTIHAIGDQGVVATSSIEFTH